MAFYDNDVDVFIDSAQLQARVRELGAQITRDYQGQPLTLLGILKGSVMFMTDLARAIGNPDAQRAVGMANGRNRIALLIPCHRVVNTGGALGGYSGGLGRKRWLLELERRPR